jgi:peptidoglycan/LPS O-acetylase OafA/YrhL
MSTPSAKTPRPRLNSLTGLRFVAAALVFVYHGSLEFVFSDQKVQSGYLADAGTTGFVGVSFFFILSGFVLTWSARPGERATSFWRRRVFKIVPNYLVTFVAALVLLAWIGQAGGVSQAVTNLFFLQSWVPNISYLGSVNDVSWTLSVEAFFYLGFPLLILLVNRIRENRLWYWAGATVVGVLLAPVAAYAFLPSQPHFIWGPGSLTQIWFVYYFPAVRAFEFVLGVLLARIVRSGRWVQWYGLLPATFVAVVGYVVSLHVPFLFRFAAATAIPLALLIPAAATADIAGRRTVLSSRVMVRLGEISFAFYLVHHLVIVYGHRAFGLSAYGYGKAWSTLPAVGFLVGCFVVSLVLAWALYELVERPAMRRWSVSRPKAEQVVAVDQADVGQAEPQLPVGAAAAAAAAAAEGEPVAVV